MPEFGAFHFMTGDSSSYICMTDLLPGGILGQCDPNSHIVTISPRGSGQQFLDTMIHEYLHAELPHWQHNRINQVSGVLSVHLHALGYRIDGSRLAPDQERMARIIADMFNQVARDLEGPFIRAAAGAMATYLTTAGYCRLRRGKHGRRNPDCEPGGPRSGKSGSRSGRGGRGGRGKKIGFAAPEGAAPAPAPRRVDARRTSRRERRVCKNGT